jgi:aminopeptidase N
VGPVPPAAAAASPVATSEAARAAPGVGASGIDITSYEASLVLDMRAHTVSGTTRIRYLSAPGAPLRLPLDSLNIDAVRSGGVPLPFRVDGGELVIPSPSASAASASGATGALDANAVEITHHSAPDGGLVFGERYVYTDFFTCRWLPCQPEPGDKATFRLELVVPESYRVVASGRPIESGPVESTPQAGNSAEPRRRFVWWEEQPQSSYLFGFVAGELSEAKLASKGAELRVFGVNRKAAELERSFEPTPGMLRFLEEKAGTPLPRASYVQVLVPGSVAQEKSSFSVLGSDEVDPILTDPTEDWAIVHELAHQWWGNSITCKTWGEFWLNEGITSFMVAAYKEQRWGAAAYERELGLWRQRHQRAVDAGHDHRLAYAGEYPSLQLRRAIMYSKAALFLDHLRRALGEEAFWAGIRGYTRAHLGTSVESRDFQRDMEAASGRDLSGEFNDWVYE